MAAVIDRFMTGTAPKVSASAPVTAPAVARVAPSPVEEGRRRRYSPEEVEAVLVEVIEALKGSEDGAGREWLRQRLGFAKEDKAREAALSKALGLGIESHQLKLVGEKRSAKYVLPSEGQAKGRVKKRAKA